MEAIFQTSGNICVENERIWCRDAHRYMKPVELYAENGNWTVHFLRAKTDGGSFSERNIMVAFSYEHFPYDVKQCITSFYSGEVAINDDTWGVINDSLMVDSGEAIFCNKEPGGAELFPNTDSEHRVSWGETGLKMRTGFGDGNYNVYTFVKRENGYIHPMLIVADFMIFAGNVDVE